GAVLAVSLGPSEGWRKGTYRAVLPPKLAVLIIRATPHGSISVAIVTALPLTCRNLKDIYGADEIKSRVRHIDIGGTPDSLGELERFSLSGQGDCWTRIEPRQPVEALNRVRRFELSTHWTTPDLQRWLNWPGRDPADKLRARPGTWDRRRPTACEAQEDRTIDLVALCGGRFGSKRCKPDRDDRGS
ncbi:hypothetical protein O4H53_26420, partial [Sulfitobacter sp. G21635-S1]|uniref:hypothetical protein n=1 Tax=Sulfitobacter sp. G21635-S1 TaxID=3014043 RepID=UPI0022B072E5